VEKPQLLIILAPWVSLFILPMMRLEIMSSAGVINAIKETLARQFLKIIF
jgi:hypothetical protein